MSASNAIIALRCTDCGTPIGNDEGPPDGWQLEDGRTVCQKCCANDLRRLARLFKAALYETPRGPLQTYVNSSAERVYIVKRSIDHAALKDAMRAPGMQKTVICAIQRRIKQLDGDRG